MTRHVERIEPTTGTDVLVVVAVVAVVTFLPTLVAVVIGLVRHGFTPWVLVALGGGLLWPTVFGLHGALSNRRADRERIALVVDDAGVYLGGRRSRRISWADVAEVALITQHVPPVRPGPPPSVHHYAAFRLHDAKPGRAPLRWRPRKPCRDEQALRSIERTVRQVAPGVPLTVTTVP